MYVLFITYTSVELVTIRVTINGAEAIIKYSHFPFVPVLCFHIKGRFKFIDSGRHCCFSVFLIKSYTTESTRDMGQESAEKRQTNKGRKLDRLLSTSSLLLSVLCCIAILELRTQEHHRLISHSTSGTFRDEMETEILRKVQLEYGRWREAIVSHLEGEWQKIRQEVSCVTFCILDFYLS